MQMAHYSLCCARILDDQERAPLWPANALQFGLCFYISLSKNDRSDLFKLTYIFLRAIHTATKRKEKKKKSEQALAVF